MNDPAHSAPERRAVGIELPDQQRLYIYNDDPASTDDIEQASEVMFAAEHATYLLWSVRFYGAQGDRHGHRHIGETAARMRLHLGAGFAIATLEHADRTLVTRGAGEFPNPGQYVTERDIYPADPRITRDLAVLVVREFAASADQPECVDWMQPTGTVAAGPYGARLPGSIGDDTPTTRDWAPGRSRT